MTKVDYTALTGGLDFVSGTVAVKPGRVSECLNFEQVFGKQGYKRIDGYERFDGRPEPHKASYYIQEFDQGELEPLVGDTITGATASAQVLAVMLESGTWAGGDAVGKLIVYLTTGDWVTGQDILKGGNLVGVATADSYIGRASNAVDHKAYLRAAQTIRRTPITKMTGSGAVRGVAVYRDVVYAVRDSVDGLSATLWKSSGSGWASVRTGLLPGGSFDFVVANFSGDSQGSALYGCDGRNLPFKWDGGTYTEMAPIFGTQATSSSSIAVGTGSKVFAVAESSRSWVVGDLLTIHSSANGANRMSGNITAYAHPNVTVNVTVAVGSGTHTDWRIGQADFEDKPYLIAAHKDHMFLAFPRGQLQTSNLGNPMVYTTSAALFGVGEEITGISSLKGSVLGVFCDNKVSILEGSNSTDWVLGLHAQNIGTKLKTMQENAGNALMLGARGLVSLQATQSFGSFEPAVWSRDVKPYLDARLTMATCSRIVRGKYQYRIYFSDGVVLSACILSPSAVVQPKDVSFMRQEYAHQVSCVASGLYGVEEAMFFGTADGWVMREDVGQSFDGAEIDSVLRLHFNTLKMPESKKRFRKLTLELESTDAVSIRFRQLFDLSDGTYKTSIDRDSITSGIGGQWDADAWDTFYWSLPIATQAENNIDGVGRSMSLLIWTTSDIDEPITLQGMILQYSILGMQR